MTIPPARASISNLPTIELQKRILALYDHLYANSSVRTPTAIAREVGKILHTGMFIETNLGNNLPAFNFEKVHLKQILNGDASLWDGFANEVRQGYKKMNSEWRFYESDEEIALSDANILYVCAQLDGVLISSEERDVFGDALEIFRGQWAKREGGQFFTDQRVTNLAISLLDFNPLRGDDLVDICSGTGGFLLSGLERIRELLRSNNITSEAKLLGYAAKSLKGQEIDPNVCMIANATLGARLSNLDHSLVTNDNSLLAQLFEEGTTNGIKYDSHRCIATNPPFGTKITVKDREILERYELANGNGRLVHRAPDTLFLEQNLKLLKPGVGRMAIVTPYQILSGPQSQFIREWLLKHAQILAVIDLPADTFQPHTGTKTSLVVVKRRKKPLHDVSEIDDTPVFMSIPRHIGHDRRGNPIYKRDSKGKLIPEVLSDIEDVARAYAAFKEGGEPGHIHSDSFVVQSSRFIEDPALRINALYHKPLGSQTSKSLTKFRYVRIKDVVKDIFYPTRFKRSYVDYYEGAVPFLGGSNISQFLVVSDKYLHHEDQKLHDLRVKPGWILITRSGSTGIVSSVPAAWDGFAMSEHVIRIVPNEEKLPPEYLLAYLRSRYAQRLLAKGVFGSVIDEITPEFIGELEIPIPKSKQILASIVAKVRASEKARNTAIFELLSGVSAVDDILG